MSDFINKEKINTSSLIDTSAGELEIKKQLDQYSKQDAYVEERKQAERLKQALIDYKESVLKDYRQSEKTDELKDYRQSEKTDELKDYRQSEKTDELKDYIGKSR